MNRIYFHSTVIICNIWIDRKKANISSLNPAMLIVPLSNADKDETSKNAAASD